MMEGERSMEQQKLEVMQNTTKGTRNHSSVAYDFVTLEYHATPAGREIFFPSFPSPFPLFLASFSLVTSQTTPPVRRNNHSSGTLPIHRHAAALRGRHVKVPRRGPDREAAQVQLGRWIQSHYGGRAPPLETPGQAEQ